MSFPVRAKPHVTQISPTPLLNVPAGKTEPVTAGQPIARFIPGSNTGIETGFAAEPGLFSAEAMLIGQAARGTDPGQNRSACGQLMSDLIASLRGPPGQPEGKPVIGTGGQQLAAGQPVTVANCPPLSAGSPISTA